MEFYNTRMGNKFYNVDIPRLISALETIADHLSGEIEYNLIPEEAFLEESKNGWRFVSQLQSGSILVERRI